MAGQSKLARLGYTGMAKETTQGTYVPPTVILPTSPPSWEDVVTEIADESLRNNDSILQGWYPGPIDSDVGFDTDAYPDLTGHLLRAIIGPDTVTAGVATTITAAAAAGATTVTVASATGITVGSVISIGGVTTEYAKVTTIATLTLTLAAPLQYAHASASAVATQTVHTFKQSNTRMPSYSLTIYNVVESRGIPGCEMSELGIKIDPKGAVSLTTKWTGYPSASQPNPTPSFTNTQPLLGWQWNMTTFNGLTGASASSDRGITYDLSIKREVEAVHGSTGTQAPSEVFPGALTVDGTLKARFYDNSDLLVFQQSIQQPVVCSIQQPTGFNQMGANLTVTTSQAAWSKGKQNFDQKYTDADFTIRGVANSIDGGSLAATLSNFTAAAY